MTNNPQRLAWVTMFSAMIIFCALCVSTVIFVRWLVFESPTQISVMVYVGRNTISLAEPEQSDEKAIRIPTRISSGDRLSTDNSSQGYLAFSDPYSGEMIATVLLHYNSMISLETANRPRFSLSSNPYTIHLTNATGQFEIWVNDNLERDIRLNVESPLGVTRIEEGGRYFVDSNAGSLIVSVRDGTAIVIDSNRRAQHVGKSLEAAITLGDPNIRVYEGPIELLPNSTFAKARDQEWPVNWVCSSTTDNPAEPEGRYKWPIVDGRPVILIQRLPATPVGHGDTGCQQFLADQENGLNVAQYDNLYLRVTMQVNYQKLGICGEQGSECPVMLHMVYRDRNNNKRDWFHGFYAEYVPNAGPLRCGSCLEDHEKINKGAWYTYEINLMEALPKEPKENDMRPGSIIEIKFYASGHEYEVMLSEVSLLASNRSNNDTAAR